MTRLFDTFTMHKTAAGFRRPCRRRIAGLLGMVTVLVAGMAGLASATPAAAQGSTDWTSYLYNADHSSYNSAVTSITTSNVSNLQPVWRGMQPASANGIFYASPILANGVLYIGGENGYFYAVSETTHVLLWSMFMGTTPSAACGSPAGITSTAAVADDPTTGWTVYVNAPDGQLYALNATTGAIDWQATVDTPSTTQDDYYAFASPLVANGNVYVGISSECDEPLVPAGVLAFNQDTGAQVADWHSLPTGDTGASVWSSPGESTLGDGSIFVTTGNDNAPQSNQIPYGESIVRLSSTLSLLDYWQVPASQRSDDGDFGGSLTDFTATINGTSTQMVGACNKNGIYYAFAQDDLAAGPVWQDQLADPSGTGPDANGECDAAAIWDGTKLIEGVGNTTNINGTTYQGSVVSLNPTTGTPIWQTGLPGAVIGSPSEDGAGVVAAPVFISTTGNLGVYLLSASTGAILDFISTGPDAIFAQPVFANNVLWVAGGRATGITAYQITKPGPPITGVSPDAIGQGGTETVTLTGSGFSGSPSVWVSGVGVTVGSVVVKSSTELQVNLTVGVQAPAGSRNIAVESGLTADTCSNCLAIDPGPAISNLNPNSLTAGTTTPVTVTGSNFVSGLTVRTNIPGATLGTPTNVTSTSFTVNVTVPATAAAGNYSLEAVNPDGGAATATISVTS